MPPSHVMLIRHAEKPSEDGSIVGVAEDGSVSKNELSVRGWQRAGALCPFFVSINKRAAAVGLVTPKFLFAAAVDGPVKSLRPQHTVASLASVLNCGVNTDFKKGEEPLVAKAILDRDGPVLVCWEHHALPLIAQSIPGVAAQLPGHSWPDDRFDVVWLLRSGPQGWLFDEVPQLLLSGDVDQGI